VNIKSAEERLRESGLSEVEIKDIQRQTKLPVFEAVRIQKALRPLGYMVSGFEKNGGCSTLKLIHDTPEFLVESGLPVAPAVSTCDE
jgi:hypothetical protein